jgi:AraC-like DNA-binding protein
VPVRITDLEVWQALIKALFFAVELSAPPGAAFEGRVRQRRLGAVDFAQVAASGHRFRRSARDVARHPVELYDVNLMLAGRGVLRQDGRTADLSPGTLVAADTTRPYEMVFGGHFRLVQLLVPRPLLEPLARQSSPVTGVPLSARRGAAAVFAALVAQLDERADPLAPATGVPVGDAVVSLCRAVFAEAAGCHAAAADREELLARIVGWIEVHLDDAELNPEAVARAHHISTRYLHKLFEEHPVPVARFIRDRRLERIRQDLVAPELYAQPVSAVAARWGMPDSNRFSRVFRERYGMSPRDYRATLPGVSGHGDGSGAGGETVRPTTGIVRATT